MFDRRYWDDPPSELFTEMHGVTATVAEGGLLRVHEDTSASQHAIATALLRKEIQGATRVDIELRAHPQRNVGICFDSDNGQASQLFEPAASRVLQSSESSIFVMDAHAEHIVDGHTRLGVLFVGSNLSEYFSVRLSLHKLGETDENYPGDSAAGFEIFSCRVRSLGL